MKKLMMVLALGLMAQGAWADEHGASSGTGSSSDRAQACSFAKNNADLMKPFNATVTGHGGCDCSFQDTAGIKSWTCTVDAYWEKR